MEITDTTLIVKWICQLFGFAPYKLIRNRSNQIVKFKLNYAMCFYSLALIAAFVVSSNIALVYDFYSGHALRMRTLTLRFVFWYDTNVVCAAMVSNMIASMFAIKNERRVHYLLRKIDNDLNNFDSKNCLHSVKEKRKISLCVIGAIVLCGALLTLDFGAWMSVARKFQSQDEIHVHSGHNFFVNMYSLLPFYFMYMSFVPLHAKFSVTIYRIGQRYRLLNKLIQNYAAAVKRHGYFSSEYSKHAEDVIYRFMGIYDSLGTILKCESSEFGITIIILIVSCLFHLILSFYYIFTAILEACFAILHWVWLIFHLTRIICIIEPCHMVSAEAKQTIKCVCNLMETKHDIYVLNHFWKKLTVDQVYFNVCGICRIDRRMYISIAASVTTYLVILLQFN